jgi:hypothetical protein
MNKSKLKPTPNAKKSDQKPQPPLSVVTMGENILRPKLQRPGRGMSSNRVAGLLADHLFGRDFYNRRGVLVRLDRGNLKIYSAEELAANLNAWIDWKERSKEEEVESKGLTKNDVPLLALSPTLLEKLPPIEGLVHVSVPVVRKSGELEWLPSGLDLESGFLNLGSCSYRTDMAFDEALIVMDKVFAGLPLHHTEEAGKIVRARLLLLFLSTYGSLLLPPRAHRPILAVTANRKGCGKSETARLAIHIVNAGGDVMEEIFDAKSEFFPKLKDEKEVKKMLDAVAMTGKRFVLLDNVRDRIDSGELAAFITQTTRSVIPFYTQEDIQLPQNCQVLLTANLPRYGDDFSGGRRLVEIPLKSNVCDPNHSAVGPGIHKGKEELEAGRADILAALHSIVRHWDGLDRPSGCVVLDNFEAYCKIFGGIVEAACAGVNPFKQIPTDVSDDRTQDRNAILGECLERRLGLKNDRWTIGELRTLAEELGLFGDIVTESNDTKDVRGESNRLTKALCFDRLKDLEGPGIFYVEGVGEVHVIQRGHGRADRPGGLHYVITRA